MAALYTDLYNLVRYSVLASLELNHWEKGGVARSDVPRNRTGRNSSYSTKRGTELKKQECHELVS